MVVQILWLSRSYDCPILMYVIFHILWLSRSYGCPHLIVVHILWFDLMIVRFLWLYLMVSYGCQVTSYGCPCWWLSCWWLSSNRLQSSTLSQWQRFGQSDSSKKSKPQLQILNWSEPYSINLSVVQLLLPVKEGTTNYSIQIVQYVPREIQECNFRHYTLFYIILH